MAAYKEYDPRMDDLVVETKTIWGEDTSELSEEDKGWLAQAIHQKPHLAKSIRYERAHTGFTREITVTAEDIERLYADRFAESS